MSKYVTIFLFVLFWQTIDSKACHSSYSLKQTPCVFYFNLSQSCQSLKFVQCACKNCEDHSNGQCKYWSTFSSNSWNQCTSIWCDSSISYPLTWTSIQQCQDYIIDRKGKQNLKNDLIISITTIGAIILIIVITYCVLTRRDPFRRIQVSNRQQNLNNSAFANQLVLNISWAQDSYQSNWVYPESESMEPTKLCSICLQVKPTVKLSCHHTFHGSCIAEWLKKKKSCPECRSRDVNKIAVYCKKCLNSFIRSKIKVQNEGILKNDNLCERCKENRLI